MDMDREAILAFARREWSRVEALKREHWASQFRDRGPTAGLRAGDMLREYASRARPDWPTEQDRADDLAHHVTLKRLLAAAAHAFPRH